MSLFSRLCQLELDAVVLEVLEVEGVGKTAFADTTFSTAEVVFVARQRQVLDDFKLAISKLQAVILKFVRSCGDVSEASTIIAAALVSAKVVLLVHGAACADFDSSTTELGSRIRHDLALRRGHI